MTFPAAICVMSTFVCLYVALLTARLSKAPDWKHQRWLAVAAVSAALTFITDLPVTLRDIDPSLTIAAARVQTIAIGAGVIGWLYFSRDALGLARSWIEPVLVGALAVLSALCLIPGVGFTGETMPPIVVEWAGVSYQTASPTEIGNAMYAVTCVTVLVVVVRFWRAIQRGRREFFWHLVGSVVLVLTSINDALVSGGAYSSLLLLDAGYMVPVAAAAMAQTASLVQISLDLDKANGDLVRALAAANEAARLKSEFLANTSHELRTPLNSIINIPEGLAQYFRQVKVARCLDCHAVLELEPEDEGVAHLRCPECGTDRDMERGETIVLDIEPAVIRKHLENVGRSGKHLLSIVDDILNYSKIEAGRMAIQREPMSVSAFFSELAQVMTPVASKRGITLDFDHGADDFEFYADPVKWMQVLINLLSNAVKFSPPDGRIEVRAELDSEHVRFTVRDFGIGIAPENHAMIFEPFRQVDGGHTRAVGGTGLGLALTQKLVRLHGGDVSLESALGTGSTFTVRLPAAHQGPRPAARSETSLAPAGDRPLILALDDDDVVLETIKLALQPLGSPIVTLSDPRRLLDEVRKRRPDLLILDIMMPRLSGLSLLKELRDDPATSQLQVIVQSAYHANQDAVEVLGARWLSKPWRAAELLALVRRTLEGDPPVASSSSRDIP